MNLKRIFILAVALVAVVGVSARFLVKADSNSITFEPPTYHLGSPNAQDGWSSTGSAGPSCSGPSYDHAIASTAGFGAPASFATQSLRISNAVVSGCFGDQTFSRSLAQAAGESTAQGGISSAPPTQRHFEASFDLASTTVAYQPGLYFSTSPDRGDGARMSYLRFEDQSDGVHVFFDDYEDVAPVGNSLGDPNGCQDGGEFVETDIATLSRSAHNFRFVMDFVDGPRNDVVKVYIDGVLKATGTSWEDYFRYCEGNPSRTVDSLLFRTGGTQGSDNAPATQGMGFLIDNLKSASSNPPANGNSCKNNGWQSVTRTDGSTFKNQGDCVSYTSNGK